MRSRFRGSSTVDGSGASSRGPLVLNGTERMWPLPLKANCWLYGSLVGLLFAIAWSVRSLPHGPPRLWSVEQHAFFWYLALRIPRYVTALGLMFLGCYLGQRIRPHPLAAILGSGLASGASMTLAGGVIAVFCPRLLSHWPEWVASWLVLEGLPFGLGALCLVAAMVLLGRHRHWWSAALTGSVWAIGPLSAVALMSGTPGALRFTAEPVAGLAAVGMLLGLTFWFATRRALR